MRSPLAVALNLALTLLIAGVAFAGDDHVRWEDVIGIIQAGNLVGSGSGQVTGGGQPWSTTGGSASINLRNGDLHFRVQGLVLAGGNAIGTPDGITLVKGTLVCDTNGSAGGGNSTLVDSPDVALSPQGDADFNGTVTLPAACLNEPDIAFLIRIGGAPGGRWIANGAVRRP